MTDGWVSARSRSLGRRRLRRSVCVLVVALAVLVGCAKTVAGQASVATTAGTTASTSTSKSLSSTSNSSTSKSSSSSNSSSSGNAPGSTTGTTTTTTSTEPTTDDTETSTFTGNPNNLPLTAPGTKLKYGEGATVPVNYAGEDAVVTYSNVTVTKGSEADWVTLGADLSDAQGEEPWYLRLDVKQEAGGDLAYSSVESDLWAYTANDDYLLSVYSLEYDNPLCPLTGADGNFAIGDSYSTCLVLSVNIGETVDRVQFEGDYSFDSPYYSDPIVWKG